VVEEVTRDGGEDSVIADVEGQLDFDGAGVVEFGRPVARGLVALVEGCPAP
jgi:hypothetical protein